MKKQKPPATAFAKTKFALSQQLGVSRTTLDKFLAMPAAPQAVPGRGFDVAAVAAFVAANASNSRTLQSVDPTIRTLKTYELSLKCARLRFNIEKERGAFVLQADVEAALVATAQQMRAAIERRFYLEWPQEIAGLDVPEIRARTIPFIDALLADWLATSKQWHFVRDANEVQPLPQAPTDL